MKEEIKNKGSYDFTILLDAINKQVESYEVSEISTHELDEINNLRKMVIEVSQPSVFYYTTD